MDIPIALFLGFIAMTLAIVVFGIIKRIPVLILAGGIFLIFWSVMTDNIILDSFSEGESDDDFIYSVQSSTGQININAVTGSSLGEFPSTSSSQLFGKTFDCMRVWVGKAATPPESPVTFGVFSSTNTVIKEFGTQSVASMASGATTPYTHCLALGDTHTIALNQYIGVNYNNGDATNTLTVRVDGNNPFDGTITYRQQYLVSWTSATAQDIMMQLWLRGSEPVTETFDYEFTEIPKVLFSFFGIMIMVVSLVISKYDD